jgi:hypothetical protein
MSGEHEKKSSHNSGFHAGFHTGSGTRGGSNGSRLTRPLLGQLNGQRVLVTLTAIVVFTGTQVLARLSTGSMKTVDLVSLAIGSAAMVALFFYRQEHHSIGRVLGNNPPVVVGPLALMLFTMVPTLERQGFPALVMPLRLTIGILIIYWIGNSAPTWLAVCSMVTIVFHRWTNSISMTATFIGMSLLVLGLNNLIGNGSRADALRIPRGPSPTSPSPSAATTRPRRTQWAVVAIVFLSLVGANAFLPLTSRFAWNPENTGAFGDGNGQSRDDRGEPGPTFEGLTRQKSLDLAYRPTRSNAKVLEVLTTAEAPLFLRAQTFDEWNGRTWLQQTAPVEERSTPVGLWQARRFAIAEVRKHLRTRTTEEMLSIGTSTRSYIRAVARLRDLVPVPVEPFGGIWNIEAFADRENEVTWLSDGTAMTARNAPTDYVVLHGLPATEEVDLSRTELLLAERFSSDVTKLARDITAADVTAQDKIGSIRRWVSTNIAYDLTAKDPGRNIDPIDYLLFDAKLGSCTHFATATVALLRSIGIPARISTGFVAQEQLRPNEFTVRGKDAHAWAEIPTTNGGWIVVDTTLGAREIPEKETSPMSLWWTLYILGGLTLAGIAIAAFRRRKVRVSGLSSSPAYRRLLRAGQRVGVQMNPATSFRRFAADLDATLATRLTTRAQLAGPAEPPQSSKTLPAWTVGELSQIGTQYEAMAFGNAAAAPRLDDIAQRAAKRSRQLLRESRADMRRARWNNVRTRLHLGGNDTDSKRNSRSRRAGDR